MKKNVLLFGFLIGFLLLTSLNGIAQLKGDKFEQAKTARVANVVYVFSKTPGFIYSKEGGQYAGICVDIMDAFGKYVKSKYGITIKPTYQQAPDNSFTKMLASVKSSQGGVFGLGNITITESRKKMYNFTPPFINNISLVVTHKTIPTLNKIEDIGMGFKGMTAYIVKGSTNEIDLFKWKKAYFPDMKITYTGSAAEAVSKVANDTKGFTNVDFTYYLDAIKAKKPVKRHIAGSSSSEEIGMIMPKSNDWEPVLADFFNSGFIGGAEYNAIIQRHLGERAVKLLNSVK